MRQIAVINESTVLKDEDVNTVMQALQMQVERDWLPVWGTDARLTLVLPHQTPDPAAWWLVILDDSDQAGALGYHDLTDKGLPLAKVFAKSDITYGQHWSVTASHELLEMLADPDINLSVFVQSDQTEGTLYAYEVCDACEADRYAYDINGVKVSDFVYPSWFESFWKPRSTRFDFGGHIKAPLHLLPGGYIGTFNVSGGSGWQQHTAASADSGARLGHLNARAKIGSRRERRSTHRSHWLTSEPWTVAR